MAIDLKTLGSKLSKYRGKFKESIIEVASATGSDAARLRNIEASQVEPTGDDALILADHYRCDFKFFISNEQVAAFEHTETLYRAHGNDIIIYVLEKCRKILMTIDMPAPHNLEPNLRA